MKEREYTPQMARRLRAFFGEVREGSEEGLLFFPTLLGFADHIGVPLSTVEEWLCREPLFRAAFEEGEARARELRIAYALAGKVNTRFMQFILENDYGMGSRSRAELNGEGIEVNIRIVDGAPLADREEENGADGKDGKDDTDGEKADTDGEKSAGGAV